MEYYGNKTYEIMTFITFKTKNVHKMFTKSTKIWFNRRKENPIILINGYYY